MAFATLSIVDAADSFRVSFYINKNNEKNLFIYFLFYQLIHRKEIYSQHLMLNKLLDRMFHQNELYQEMVLKMLLNQYLEDLKKKFCFD